MEGQPLIIGLHFDMMWAGRSASTLPTNHFTIAPLLEGTIMPQKSTPAPLVGQSDRPSEEIILDLVRSGELQIDERGRIWRHKFHRGGLFYSCSPRRAEHRSPLGYLQVRSLIGSKRHHVGAHRLVWWHFNGPIAAGMVINHLNGVKSDNRPENLEATTPSGNTKHAHATGLRDQRGERNPAAKLTDHQIAEIRLAYECGGVTQQELADRHGVRFQHVSRLIRGDRRASQAGPVSKEDHRHASEQDPITGRFISTKREA